MRAYVCASVLSYIVLFNGIYVPIFVSDVPQYWPKVLAVYGILQIPVLYDGCLPVLKALPIRSGLNN